VPYFGLYGFPNQDTRVSCGQSESPARVAESPPSSQALPSTARHRLCRSTSCPFNSGGRQHSQHRHVISQSFGISGNKDIRVYRNRFERQAWTRQISGCFWAPYFVGRFNPTLVPLTMMQNTSADPSCQWSQQLFVDETNGGSATLALVTQEVLDLSSQISAMLGPFGCRHRIARDHTLLERRSAGRPAIL